MKFEDMSFEDIVNELKVLCEEGLKPSRIFKLRRALKVLSREMYVNSAAFHRPLAKNMIIEVKTKKHKIVEAVEDKVRVRKPKQEPAADIIKHAERGDVDI
jgi:hypothetical protein